MYPGRFGDNSLQFEDFLNKWKISFIFPVHNHPGWMQFRKGIKKKYFRIILFVEMVNYLILRTVPIFSLHVESVGYLGTIFFMQWLVRNVNIMRTRAHTHSRWFIWLIDWFVLFCRRTIVCRAPLTTGSTRTRSRGSRGPVYWAANQPAPGAGVQEGRLPQPRLGPSTDLFISGHNNGLFLTQSCYSTSGTKVQTKLLSFVERTNGHWVVLQS